MKEGTSKIQLRVGFVMDPIEKINLKTDTTFVLMLEAQTRGHEVIYLTPADLYVENGQPWATAVAMEVRWPRSQAESHFTADQKKERPLSSLDLIFLRVDPPYSLSYVNLCQLLGLVPPPTVVINRPAGILKANEKILALHFPELMPETIVSHEPERLLSFLSKVGGKMVVKPLSGFGGGSVFVVEKNHSNRQVILETITENGTVPVMAQRYLPVSKKGDKRIILLAGEPIGAVLRLPAKGEHRANLHAGGRCQKTTLSARERQICEKIGPWLRREGLWFAGIDVIGGYLTEINVTSPTLVQQINQFSGVKLEKRIMDFAEYLVRQAKALKSEADRNLNQ